MIDQQYKSFISNEMELKIPKDPIFIKQNKRMVSIWLEAKKQMEQELKAQKYYTTEEQEEATTPPKIKAFFKNSLKILERWLKIMIKDDSNYVGAMAVDQLFKNVLLKLDSVFTLKSQVMDREIEECREKIRVMKETCKKKIDLQLQQFNIATKRHLEIIDQLNKRVKTQHKEIEELQYSLSQQQAEH